MKSKKILHRTILTIFIASLALAGLLFQQDRFDVLRLLLLVSGAVLGILSAILASWKEDRPSNDRFAEAARSANEANEILRGSSARLSKYFGDDAKDLIPNSPLDRETLLEYMRSPLILVSALAMASIAYFHPQLVGQSPRYGLAGGVGLAALGLFCTWIFFFGLFLNCILLIKRKTK